MSAATNSISLRPCASRVGRSRPRRPRRCACDRARCWLRRPVAPRWCWPPWLLPNDGARPRTPWSALPVPAVAAVSMPSIGGIAEVAPERRRPAAVLVTTDPRQKHVVQYLSRRYRVAEEATRMLVVGGVPDRPGEQAGPAADPVGGRDRVQPESVRRKCDGSAGPDAGHDPRPRRALRAARRTDRCARPRGQHESRVRDPE